MAEDKQMKFQTVVDLSDIRLLQKELKQLRLELDAIHQYKGKDSQMFLGKAKEVAELETRIDSLKSNVKKTTAELKGLGSAADFKSYSRQVAEATLQTQKLHQQMLKTKSVADTTAFNNQLGVLKGLSAAQADFSKRISSSVENMGFFQRSLQRTRSHAEWILSGALLVGILALPNAFIDAAASAEQYSTKIRQNLELNKEYAESHEKLTEDLKILQNAAGIFATGYGIKMEEVQKAQQIISRRFKDADTINYLTNLAAIISKLDFVPMEKSASNLEAVILQFGLNAQQTQQFVNEFTVAVHTARISGTELLDALQRSGSVFKQFGAGTKEAIALVSALSTTTARSGSTIGRLIAA